MGLCFVARVAAQPTKFLKGLMSTSDRQLKHWFDKFNTRWFEGKLPSTIIFWEPPSDSFGVTCPVFEVNDKVFEIKLDPSLKGVPDYWKLLLLHEMAHIKLWPKHPKHQHGKAFQDEMKRLANEGAFKSLW